MKLDRNLNGDGLGKYAILKLRVLDKMRVSAPDFPARFKPAVQMAITVLENEHVLDWGYAGTESEFMLIRLKDKYAQAALRAYADAARTDDPEWAAEIDAMAARSGPDSPFCKKPD